MLTPAQIAALRDRVTQLADPLTEYLLADIARRISQAGQLTSTAAYQIWRTQQLSISQREIKKRLAIMLNVSQNDLKKLITQSAEAGYNFDIKRFPQVQAVAFKDNFVLQQTVNAAVKLAQSDFTNLVQTIGFVAPDGKAYELTTAYKKACDYAFQQTFTGSADYNTAIRDACKNLANSGIRTVNYESGVSISLEAAVRRNVLGGLGLMQEQISQQNHDTLGANGWEISAHGNCAPDHEPIQGKQYTDAEYKSLNNSLKRRIGTLNCGHAAFPIILGVSQPQYTPEELGKFQQDNADGITYQGKHYTGYQATQQQRALERAIRAQKRRVLIANQSTDADYQKTAKTRLTLLNQEYRRFSKAAGLRTQNERAQVAGFGRAA